MIFDTPTTKDEMIDILNDIYHFYRLQRMEYSGVTLTPLDLERMTFTPLTDEELVQKAEDMLAASQEKTLMDYVDGLEEKISELLLKKSEKQQECLLLIDENQKSYETAKETLNKEALKNGVLSSGVYAEKIMLLEKEKNQKTADINAELVSYSALIDGKISEYRTLLQNAEQKFQSVFAKQTEAKFYELKDEQEKTQREVFQYNNGLDEKEQRYLNTINQTVASFSLRHLEIRMQGPTQEELVEMGYYADVIDCVSAYYNTLSAQAAYTDIKNTPKLAIYLDDYYSQVVYFYKTKAS